MGVDDDALGLVPQDAEDDVRRLAPDAGELHELLERLRHLPAVALDEGAGKPHDRLGLHPEEAERRHVRLDLDRRSAAASAFASGKRAKSFGVALFTPTSVVCALRTTDTMSSKGERKSSSQCAVGCCCASRASVCGAIAGRLLCARASLGLRDLPRVGRHGVGDVNSARSAAGACCRRWAEA